MTEDENEEILKIVRQLKNSPAMNGEFIKLVSSVEHIKTTQSKMCTDVNVVMVKQKEARGKLDEMHEALYHPDTGIYKRIGDSMASDESQEEHLERLETTQNILDSSIDEHNVRIIEIEGTQKDLKKVAGDRMENLDSVVKMNKNTKKLFWAGTIAVVAFIVKEILPAFFLI